MMESPADGEKFVAECEYTCGYSFGPGEHPDVWRDATAHEKVCLYGGPVVRNVKTPAPAWVNDDLLMDLMMEPLVMKNGTTT